MSRPFEGLDLTDFWDDDEDDEYTSPPPSDDLVASVERELGYRLPKAYVALMKLRNGGALGRNCFPTRSPTSWADDHVALTGLFGIGRDLENSLCGETGSRFWMTEWGYPDIGVYVGDCPSAGHDLVALDYRESGPEGEPSVVHVDQELDYRVTLLAPDFESFVRGLVEEEALDEE